MDIVDDEQINVEEDDESLMRKRPASPSVLPEFSHLYPRYVQRFAVPRYSKSTLAHAPDEDMRILTHSNRICIITLSPMHPVLRQQKQVAKVLYQITDKTNRLDTAPKGKKKKGAQLLDPEAILCRLECADGTSYTVRSHISGKLCEVNSRLCDNPQLLIDCPTSEGYIAIIFPSVKTYENRIRKQLLLENDYFATFPPQEVESVLSRYAQNPKEDVAVSDPG